MSYDRNYRGLSSIDAARLLIEFGQNKLREKKGKNPIKLFLEQFSSILITILIFAAAISFLLGEVIDAIAIISIVILNAILGFVQEYRAEKSMEALKKIMNPAAKVVRDGKDSIIPASEIVPGDLVILEAGDKVPADGLLLESFSLQSDESALTGESFPVEKGVDTEKNESYPVAERTNRIFMGTAITYGRAKFVVEKTGMTTEIGKIAEMIQESKTTKTPLQEKLDAFSKDMSKAIFFIVVLIFLLGVYEGVGVFSMFLASISLAVAAIPEGLPAVVTTSLALGVHRMSKLNAVVRKLPAVETLGATTVIVSDKTGTLTENEMTIRKIWTSSAIYEVSGSGYSQEGEILVDGSPIPVNEDLEILLTAGALCNNSSIDAIGDPTEISILVAAAKAGIDKDLLDRRFERKHEIVFDSERKRMSVVASSEEGGYVYTKGAIDVVLELCSKERKQGKEIKLTDKRKSEILEANDQVAADAMRVIALAYKKYTEKDYDEKKTESELVFLGFVGMIDPPRPEARQSIEACKRAGIKPMMITGDHKTTAVAIAKELDFPEGRVLTGAELDGLSDEEFEKIVLDVYVYARMSPQHKTRIVRALQKKGETVAMTGDGVNDAPALRLADIGIAIGSGIDVAKEASTMILTDDNFATIVSAVKEGRGIYDNIRKFIFYLFSCNIGEVLTVFFAILLGSTVMNGLALPLTAIQILWMNLLTDGLPALALGMQPAEKDVMERKPRDKKEEIVNKKTVFDLIFAGLVISIGTIFMFLQFLPDTQKAQTIAFTTIVFFQLFHSLNSQSDKSLLKVGMANKYLAAAILASFLLQLAAVYMPVLDPVFGTSHLSRGEIISTILISSTIIPIVEVKKFIVRKRVGL